MDANVFLKQVPKLLYPFLNCTWWVSTVFFECKHNKSFSQFQTTVRFYIPLKHQKTSSFVMFSGSVRRKQWFQMASNEINVTEMNKP